ncbi:Short-chain dehydrogenase [Tistlia consotensis]|uniref:Short-chain dehydrogenase n=1 Tax=Tistlia consotensis USBA 355 TaxID=560819 RepID=A0A1Y6BC47_9PROT|nr:SDR family NAD(P)-dependent oxidoreductase [Tistlia consotensis]SMF00322.1 Short-chain dehydrogenase [Tistlia consotensis USBA 355]SNR75976.1 Short-chain dehydrogenase [Tistlia consotensis]
MPVDTPDPADATPAAQEEDRRLVLVTGASRGLGRALAKALAAEGAHCILTARTVGALEELDDEIVAAGGAKPTLVPLDLRQGDRIDQLGAALYERFGRLDGLAGCAGILGQFSPVGHLPPKVWDEVYAVNTTANYRLIRSLDPLLRRSAAGRALFITDVRARLATAYWSLYAGSKAALEVLVRSYAEEIRRFGVKANLACPPPMATALRRQGFPGEDQETLAKPEAIAAQLLPLLSPACERIGEIVAVTG